MRAVILETFDGPKGVRLSEVPELAAAALEQIESRRATGKIVVTMPESVDRQVVPGPPSQI